MSWDDGFGATDEDVSAAQSKFNTKRLIKLSDPEPKTVRILRGPFSAERVWWPSVKKDDETGSYRVIMMSANRPDSGWVFDDLAARDYKLQKAANVQNPYSAFSARKFYRFTAFLRDCDDPNVIRILEVKKKLYEQLMSYRNATNTRNPNLLLFGPLWSYDFNIMTVREPGKSAKFGTSYSAQPVPPQPLANKVAVTDKGKKWTLDELAASECFTDEEIAALRNQDLDPTQDLQAKSNSELLDTLDEYPIYFLHHDKEGAPYYNPRMLRDLVATCKNLEIPFIGEKLEIADPSRQLESRTQEADTVGGNAVDASSSAGAAAEEAGDTDAPVRGSRRTRGRATGAAVNW